jgi:hypothetical protein
MSESVPTPLSFVLSSLNQTTQCVDGVSLSKFTDTLAFDAMAIFYVNIDDMKNVFGYQVDGTNINNLDNENIKYYVDMEKWPANLTLNPSHAMMFNPLSQGGFDISDTSIPNSKKLVKHDYIRFLSQRLFNTTRGVDLMANEFEIIENLAGNGSLFTGMNARKILDVLNSISTTKSTSGLDGTDADNNNKKYLTNKTLIPTNIVRSIIEQISNGDPKRFNNLVDVSNNHLIRPVPFIVNDRLNFTLKIKAAPNQNDLTKVAAIPDRTYLISLILANGNAASLNLQVTDSAFIGDLPYSVYYPIAVKHDIVVDGKTVFADGAQATAIPSNMGYFNNGWYYKNNISAPMLAPTSTNPGYNLRKINWYFPPSTGAKVSDLKYIYITGQMISNKSLPFISIYTKHPNPTSLADWRLSSRTYSCGSGPSVVIPGTIAHQLVVDMSNNDGISCPSINGYSQIALTLSSSNQVGSFADTEEILAYSIGTNSANINSGDSEFILNTVCAYDNGASKIPVYYFEQI